MESIAEDNDKSDDSSSDSNSESSSSDVNQIDLDNMDSEGDEDTSSYAKFKTQNEIDLKEIEKYAPKFEQNQLDDVDTVAPFGMVVHYLDDGPHGMLLVMPES